MGGGEGRNSRNSFPDRIREFPARPQLGFAERRGENRDFGGDFWGDFGRFSGILGDFSGNSVEFPGSRHAWEIPAVGNGIQEGEQLRALYRNGIFYTIYNQGSGVPREKFRLFHEKSWEKKKPVQFPKFQLQEEDYFYFSAFRGGFSREFHDFNEGGGKKNPSN